jgi:PGF-CTERM protein
MRRRDVLRTAAAAAALPLASTAASATEQDGYAPLGHAAVEKTKEVVVSDDGQTAYLATSDGFATVDVSDPENPTVLANPRKILSDRENGPLPMIYDVKVDGDTLIVVGPANGTQEETLQGMAVYDVSDPANPELRSFYDTEFPIHNAFLADGIAYLTANNRADNPAVMVDVTGDSATEVGRWSVFDHDADWGQVHWYLRTTHDIYVQDDTMYLAMWDAGSWMVDVSDPANPSYVNHVGHYDREELSAVENIGREGTTVPGNSHYVAVNDDASILASGAEAWDIDTTDEDDGQGGIDLWDVSDPQNPEKLSFVAPPPTPNGTREGTWTTSHNLDFHGDRLYTSWYEGGVKIHDVSDPANPEELAWWRQPGKGKYWTAQFASEDFFVAGDMMASEEYPSGIYTFPNREGEQSDPPQLVEDQTTTTTTTTTTPTQTTTTTTTATPTDTPTATQSDESGGSPGFGVLSALAGVSAAALAGWRRLD